MVATVVGICAVAAAVAAVDPERARGWLGFRFDPPRATLGTAADTFASNAALALVAVGAAVGLAALAAARVSEQWRTRQLFCVTRLWADLALGVLWAANVAVVGAGLGAYGERFVRALLPHGPIELAGFAVSLGAYLEARAGRAGIPVLTWVGVVAIVLLAIAAPLETWGAA
jgi:hypothetical protein